MLPISLMKICLKVCDNKIISSLIYLYVILNRTSIYAFYLYAFNSLDTRKLHESSFPKQNLKRAFIKIKQKNLVLFRIKEKKRYIIC